MSTAPGNGCQSLALAVCACVLTGERRRSVLLVGPTQAAAVESAGRVLSMLGIRATDGRRKLARSTQSRKLGQRFRQRSSHLGARIEAVKTRSVLRTAGARGAWPDDVDLVVAVRVGEWPTSQAGKLHDVGRYLATGSRPADALHPFEVLVRAAQTDPERGAVYAADPEAADQDPLDTDVWRAANPAGELHEGILREVEAARTDPVAASSFAARRLNLGPDADGDGVPLFRASELQRIFNRPEPPRLGHPLVGIDIGGSRTWTAAVAVWLSGRIEVRACSPGVKSVAVMEGLDSQPRGTYEALERAGVLTVHTGRNESDVRSFLASLAAEWGPAYAVVADRYRAGLLRDACLDAGWPAPIERGTRHEAASEDVGRCRRAMLDGLLGVEERSRGLLTLGIAETRLRPDDSAVKRRESNRSRDDVAQSLILAVAEATREDDGLLYGLEGEPEDIPVEGVAVDTG